MKRQEDASGRRWLAAAIVGVGACLYRFIELDLTNDDVLFLAVGRQIAAFDEWPVRDLFEEGDPLHNLISAALQRLVGHALAGEVLFDIVMLALAAALVTLIASRVMRSSLAGALIGTLTVLAWPRLYDYPKAILPATAIWLCLRFEEKPSLRLAAGIGAAGGIAFLLRHDFGAYVAVAAVVAIGAGTWPRRTFLRDSLIACAGTAALVAGPYLAYVQTHIGLSRYLASAQRFTEREVSRSDDRRPAFVFDWSRPFLEYTAMPVKIRWAAAVDEAGRTAAEQRYGLRSGRLEQGRTWAYALTDTSTANVAALVRDPLVEDTANIDRSIGRDAMPRAPSRLLRMFDSPVTLAPGILTRNNAVAWLYYTYETLPWVALIVIAAAVATTRRLDVPLARVLPAAGFCVVAAPLLLRGNLYQNTRLADFTTPAVLLAALMIASSWRAPLPRVASNAIRLLIASVSFITVMAVCSFGQSTVHAGRLAAFVDEGGVHDEALRLWQGLFAVPPRLDWVPREGGVRGAVEYLRQCTGAHDRVLVFGFYPDIVFFSGRGAATDRMVLLRGFATHPDDEGRLLTAMRRHPAAVAIVGSDSGNGSAGGRVLDGVHPLLEQYLVSHYTRVATTGFAGSSGAAFDVWAMTDRRPSGTGPFDLPCFGNPTGR